MKKPTEATQKFDTKKSIARAQKRRGAKPLWRLRVADLEVTWSSKMERVALIRKGLPYESIDVISERTGLPVKHILFLLGVPQTTYNKKKRENSLLNGRDTEIILLLTELLDLGVEVFNDEGDKFHRWLKKPNMSLGGLRPDSLFDSVTGIQEVRNCLNRLESGNMA